MKKTFIALIVSLAAAANAYTFYPLPFTIAAVASVQNATTYNGNIATELKPVQYAINNKVLLANLASDEYFLGNYGFTNFPAGSQIYLMYCPKAIDQSYFVVMFANAVLCDLSDVMTFSPDNSPVVETGTYDNSTGLLISVTDTYAAAVNIDETAAGKTDSFYLGGLLTGTGTDKTAAPFYVETWKMAAKTALGSGITGGSSGVTLTGSFSFAGNVQGTLPRN
jgi:hypothetical protein